MKSILQACFVGILAAAGLGAGNKAAFQTAWGQAALWGLAGMVLMVVAVGAARPGRREPRA